MSGSTANIACEIHRLKRAHAPRIFALAKDTVEFGVAPGGDMWEMDDIDRWLLDKDDLCLGLFCGSRLVGFTLSHFHQATGKIHMENIYVHPEWRGRKWGQALVAELLKLYSERNTGRTLRFVALVDPSNSISRRLLKNFQFHEGEQVAWHQRTLFVVTDRTDQ